MTFETVDAFGTIRVLSPDEGRDAIAMLESWLGWGTGLARTYPQVFHPDGNATRFGVFVDDRLAAHTAARLVRAVVPGGEMPVALLGGVATAPEHRSRGLASALLDRVLTTAAGAGAAAALLWSGEWPFYQRLGFAPAGRQLEVTVRARPGSLAQGIRPAQAGDLPALLALHHKKPLRIERDLGTLALQLSAAPMTTMVLEHDRGIVAYACCGKGLDFTGWWHELGGDDDDVRTLVLGAMNVLGQEHATLLLPPYREGLVSALGRAVIEAREGAAALRRALDANGHADLFVDGLDSI